MSDASDVRNGELLSAEVLQPATVARALRHSHRREALAVVLERQTPVPVGTIAHVLATNRTTEGAGRSGRASIHTALHHRHLPVLGDAELIAWDRHDRTVVPGEHRLLAHPAFDAAWLRREDERWDALAAVFGQPRRRVVVSLLARRESPVPTDDLARALAAELVGDLATDADLIESLETRLHHVDLPMLDDAGVVTYDAANTRVVGIHDPDLPLPVEGL